MIRPWTYGPDGRGRFLAVYRCPDCGVHVVSGYVSGGRDAAVAVVRERYQHHREVDHVATALWVLPVVALRSPVGVELGAVA